MLIGIDASRAFVKDKTGTENYSYELIREILKLKESQKHKFRLYVRDGRKVPIYDEDRNQRANVEVVEIGWRRLWTQGGLALECLRRPVDVLWIPAHTLPVVRNPKMKTVVTIHGLEYEYLPGYYDWRKKWYLNKSTEYAVKKADKLIAVSNWTKSQLVDRLGADKSKITVVYEGIGSGFMTEGSATQGSDLRRRSEPKKVRNQVKYKYSLPEKYALFIGTIQPRKNLVRLIEAYAKLAKGSELARGVRNQRRSSEPQLVIGGNKGWMAEEIYQAPKKYGVEKGVRFIGRVAEADLPAVYQMARVFVWPSLMEGFGLPILEAMKMGVPVICSNRGALPEVGGKAALMVDPEKVGHIAEAMKLVLGNQELREGLVEQGYRQVERFSWQKAAKETLRVLTD